MNVRHEDTEKFTVKDVEEVNDVDDQDDENRMWENECTELEDVMRLMNEVEGFPPVYQLEWMKMTLAYSLRKL